MRKIRLFIVLALARFSIRILNRIGFIVLPAHRAKQSIDSAQRITALMRSGGTNFRDKARRREAGIHAVRVSTALQVGVQEVVGLLNNAVSDSF